MLCTNYEVCWVAFLCKPGSLLTLVGVDEGSTLHYSNFSAIIPLPDALAAPTLFFTLCILPLLVHLAVFQGTTTTRLAKRTNLRARVHDVVSCRGVPTQCGYCAKLCSSALPTQALLQPLPWIRQKACLWDVFGDGMRFSSPMQPI